MKQSITAFLIVASLTASYVSAIAQDNSRRFDLEVEYSPNYSKLTNEIVEERLKISHNALLRVTYLTGGRLQPSAGIGFFNTGEVEKDKIIGDSELESVKFIQNYNYIYVPVGIRVDLDNFYLRPELAMAIALVHRSKVIAKEIDGERRVYKSEAELASGEFNKVAFPLSLAIGKDFKLAKLSLSSGLKGYYGLNQVVRNVRRDNHFFGFGLFVAGSLN